MATPADAGALLRQILLLPDGSDDADDLCDALRAAVGATPPPRIAGALVDDLLRQLRASCAPGRHGVLLRALCHLLTGSTSGPRLLRQQLLDAGAVDAAAASMRRALRGGGPDELALVSAVCWASTAIVSALICSSDDTGIEVSTGACGMPHGCAAAPAAHRQPAAGAAGADAPG